MAVLLETNTIDNVGSCSILSSRISLFGIPQLWAGVYAGQPEGIELCVAVRTLVCTANQRSSLLVLKFYLELIIHPGKRVKIIYFPSLFSFLYFMTQNHDLRFSIAFHSRL